MPFGMIQEKKSDFQRISEMSILHAVKAVTGSRRGAVQRGRGFTAENTVGRPGTGRSAGWLALWFSDGRIPGAPGM